VDARAYHSVHQLQGKLNLPRRSGRNIEAICDSEAELRRQIRATLLHEVGHYFGLSEDELRGM